MPKTAKRRGSKAQLPEGVKNRSTWIRNYLTANPGTAPADVVAAGKAVGIGFTVNLVSNVRMNMEKAGKLHPQPRQRQTKRASFSALHDMPIGMRRKKALDTAFHQVPAAHMGLVAQCAKEVGSLQALLRAANALLALQE